MTLSGSAKSHHTARRKLRKKLQGQGLSPDEIERRVSELAARQGRPFDPPVTVSETRQDRIRRRAEGHQERAALAAQHQAQQEMDRAVWLRQRERLEREVYAAPDDRRYRPPSPDPLLKGAARATGATARAVRRKSTYTKWQLDEAEGRR